MVYTTKNAVQKIARIHKNSQAAIKIAENIERPIYILVKLSYNNHAMRDRNSFVQDTVASDWTLSRKERQYP